MTFRTVLVQYIEFCVVVCNFDDFVDRLMGKITEIIKLVFNLVISKKKK